MTIKYIAGKCFAGVWTAALLWGVLGLSAFAQMPPENRGPESGGIDLSGVDQLLPTEPVPTENAPTNNVPTSNAPAAEESALNPTVPPASDTENAPLSAASETLAAAENPADSSTFAASGGSSFWELVKAGGWIGGVIFLLSLIACALSIQFLLTIRRAALLPPELLTELRDAIERGRLSSAMDRCGKDSSFLARVVLGGLKNFDGGWEDVEQGASETLASETARIYRQTEFLSVIGNIAPMLGLLGTVIGMVMAFGELASSDGLGRFANLAQGIYFALVTTVDGLLVAIPTLCAYSFFNHRAATLSAECAARVEELFRPLRKHFLTQKATGASASGANASSANASGGVSVGTSSAASAATPPAPPRAIPSLKSHRRLGGDDSE